MAAKILCKQLITIKLSCYLRLFRRITLVKLLVLFTVFFTLTACEIEKQDQGTVGAVPKQIIDKTTDDINKATAIAAEKLKAAENEADSGSGGK